MSHHNSIQNNAPTKRNFITADLPKAIGNHSVPLDEEALLIKGQGAFVFGVPDSERPTAVEITFSTDKGEAISLKINDNDANFYYRKTSDARLTAFKLENQSRVPDGYTKGIDANKKCLYWVSIDCINKRLRYGKGEMRKSTALIDYEYDKPKNLFTAKKKSHYPFIDDLKTFSVTKGVHKLTLWKDPVVDEPPALVVKPEDFTMEAAANNTAATPTSLSKECQILYGNVASFELNTPDFPDFEQALEYSIRTKGCVANKIIRQKLKHSPFNADNATSDDVYKEVYLRITLGSAQGESPGIPYVMEIWPVGCASPIHHHGFTHAIIKVLRGEIDVDIYRMLPSASSSDKPLDVKTFKTGQVTYLMPQVNQFHKLKNHIKNRKTCITIQSYSYSQDDNTHYPTFDYVEGNDEKVNHFDPISDYDFIAFKKKVKKEWHSYLEKKFWMKTKKKK